MVEPMKKSESEDESVTMDKFQAVRSRGEDGVMVCIVSEGPL